jgi:PAS domain S-box-containing protein
VREQTDEGLRSERLKTDELLKPTEYAELQRALEHERHAEDDAVREERARADEAVRQLAETRKAEAPAVARVPFALLVEQVRHYAIYMLDPEGNVVSWNRGAEQLTGYRPEEILGKHFSVFFLEDDVNFGKPSEALRIAFQEGHFEQEGWRVRKDGTTYVANVVLTPLIEHGKLAGFASITRNVTERFTSAEKAFRRSEEILRLAAEATGLGTWDLDIATGVLELSDRCKTIMGIDPSEPVTLDRFRMAVHPADRSHTEEAFRHAQEPSSAGTFNIECRILRPSGSAVRVAAMGRVMFAGTGPERAPRRFIGTMLDLTSRKKIAGV